MQLMTTDQKSDRRACTSAHRRIAFGASLLLLWMGIASCGGHRMLKVTSQPSGALVRLDEDVIGTTPLEFEFDHYGHRRLSLYRVGFRSYSEPIHLKAPWHSRFPIDVFTEVIIPLGLSYEKEYHVELEVDDGEQVYESLNTFIERAEELRRGLPGQAPKTDDAETQSGDPQ